MQMVKTPIGVVFTDSLRNSVGAAAFSIDHDFFIKQDLVVRTAAGGGGTLLTEDTDYTLGGEDTVLSAATTAAVGAGRNVMHTITVINAAYQACDLYFSGKFVADALDPTRITTMGRCAKSANYTILDWENDRTYEITTGAADKTLTLPTLADNQGKKITGMKTDSGVGELVLDGEGGEVFLFQGATYTTIRVGKQYQHVTVEATSAGWLITDGVVQSVALEPDIGGGKHLHKYVFLNLDPADTNWHEIDLSGQVPTGTILIEGETFVNSVTTSGRVLYMSDATGGAEYSHTREFVVAIGAYGKFTVPLSAARTIWYKVDNADVNLAWAEMHFYILGPA